MERSLDLGAASVERADVLELLDDVCEGLGLVGADLVRGLVVEGELPAAAQNAAFADTRAPLAPASKSRAQN
jgi:hypothetical protein